MRSNFHGNIRNHFHVSHCKNNCTSRTNYSYCWIVKTRPGLWRGRLWLSQLPREACTRSKLACVTVDVVRHCSVDCYCDVRINGVIIDETRRLKTFSVLDLYDVVNEN
jgi:hypothetical protein